MVYNVNKILSKDKYLVVPEKSSKMANNVYKTLSKGKV